MSLPGASWSDFSSIAFQKDRMVPDILTISKTLGGGLPLSTAIVSEETKQLSYHVTSSSTPHIYTTHIQLRSGRRCFKVVQEGNLAGLARMSEQYFERSRSLIRSFFSIHGHTCSAFWLPGVVKSRDVVAGAVSS